MNAPTSPITPEIRKVIEDQLPGQVGTILKERLALLEKLEPQVRDLQQTNSTLNHKISQLEKDIQGQEVLDKKADRAKSPARRYLSS